MPPLIPTDILESLKLARGTDLLALAERCAHPELAAKLRGLDNYPRAHCPTATADVPGWLANLVAGLDDAARSHLVALVRGDTDSAAELPPPETFEPAPEPAFTAAAAE